MPDAPFPPQPPLDPIELVHVDRSHRAVLANLGQLYRYDLSEAYGHLPNSDGTFNNRRLDQFLAGQEGRRAWLITVAGAVGGFVMTDRNSAAELAVADFFVVRALRRCGVGRIAAGLAIATASGTWRIGFQRYNPGVERFWLQVASDTAGSSWSMRDDEPVQGRPPDTWITFTT